MNALSFAVPKRLHQLKRALREAGDTHDLTDILADIACGQMQSFVWHESWAITRIIIFPRKKVVEVFLVMGDDADMPELEAQVKRFARLEGATMIRAMGREGWARRASERGWIVGPRLYLTEV